MKLYWITILIALCCTAGDFHAQLEQGNRVYSLYGSGAIAGNAPRDVRIELLPSRESIFRKGHAFGLGMEYGFVRDISRYRYDREDRVHSLGLTPYYRKYFRFGSFAIAPHAGVHATLVGTYIREGSKVLRDNFYAVGYCVGMGLEYFPTKNLAIDVFPYWNHQYPFKHPRDLIGTSNQGAKLIPILFGFRYFVSPKL